MVDALLLVGYGGRSARHEILALETFGEGHDVTDAGGAALDRHQPVQAEGDAAVRRTAALQRVHQVVQRRWVDAQNLREKIDHNKNTVGRN